MYTHKYMHTNLMKTEQTVYCTYINFWDCICIIVMQDITIGRSGWWVHQTAEVRVWISKEQIKTIITLTDEFFHSDHAELALCFRITDLG